MPLTPSERETVATCSKSTLARIRAAHKGDSDALQQIAKMRGCNDEVAMSVDGDIRSRYEPRDYVDSSRQSTTFTGPAPGCPLAWTMFMVGLVATGFFVHDLVVLLLSAVGS